MAAISVSISRKAFDNEAHARFDAGCVFLVRYMADFNIKLSCVVKKERLEVSVSGGSEAQRLSAFFATLSWMLLAGLPIDESCPKEFRQTYNIVSAMGTNPFLDGLKIAIDDAFTDMEKWR